MRDPLKITALAGGVGGAKLAHGLSKIKPAGQLSIIVNTGDDLEFFGLHISPDVDTVCYTLSGLANPQTGWGLADETWRVFESLERLGGPSWFKLGDRDIALHMERTRLMSTGLSMTDVTRELCRRLDVKDRVIPMCNEPVRTVVETRDGRRLGFQEYFVKEQCQPEVTGFTFDGIKESKLSAEVRECLNSSGLVVICPSNPWVSIGPILSVNGIRDLLVDKTVIAVSPIIGGKTIKGPAAKMFNELGLEASSIAVARHYQGLISGLVLDRQDESEAEAISRLGIIPLVTQTIMRSDEDRMQLAKEVLEFGIQILEKGA